MMQYMMSATDCVQMLQMVNGGSCGSEASISSDAGELSEDGEPLHEESILQELFYAHLVSCHRSTV